MKLHFLIIPVLMFSFGCQQPSTGNVEPTPRATQITVTKVTPTVANFEQISADKVLSAFKSANLPVIDEEIYTEESDQNHLLGRPGQYTEKINFSDKRSKAKNAVPVGNSIEVFKSQEDLDRRKTYTEGMSKAGGMFLQYIYAHKNVLLRLDHRLLPKEAEEYKSVLEGL